MVTQPSLKAMGTSLGIGLAAAIVLALINAIVITSKLSSVINMAEVAAQGSTASGNPASISMPNFLQVLVSALISGVAGSYSLKISAMGMDVDKIGAHISLWGPMTLSGVALLIGAAFGAYLLAHKTTSRFKWDGIANSVVVGLLTGLIYVILGAIFPLSFSGAISGGSSPLSDLSSSLMGGSQSSSANGSMLVSGATPRTFLMATVFAGFGALLGFALAQYAPDSTNVFKAAWRWAHRLRGFARTTVEAFSIYTLVYTVLGLVAFIVLAFVVKIPSLLLFIPSLFPLWPLFLLEFSSFGGLGLSALGMVSGDLTCFTLFGWTGLAKINGNGDIVKSVPPQLTTPGALPIPGGLIAITIVLIVVFILTTLYIALRAAARNMQDRYYMGWKHTWKQPVAVGIFWLFATFVSATGLSVKIGGVAGMATNLLGGVISSATGGIDPSKLHGSISLELWYFLVAMVWAFLIEVVAMTFGPTLVASMPFLWKIFKGGQVEATPAAVRQYVNACDARFGKAQKNERGGQAGPGGNTPEGSAGSAGSPWPGNPNGSTGPNGSTVPGSPNAPQGTANATFPLPTQGSSLPTSGPSLPTPNPASTGPLPAPSQAGTPQGNGPSPLPGTQPVNGEYMRSMAGDGSDALASPAETYMSTFADDSPQENLVPPALSGAASTAKPINAKQKRIIIICSAVVGACVLLGIVYGVLNATVFSAKTVVNQYTDAIASGDFDHANAIADPQVSGKKAALLTNKAAKQGSTISNARATSTTRNADGSTSVSLTYTLSGKTHNETLNLASKGRQLLIFNKWVITTPLVSNLHVSGPNAVKELNINGISITDENSSDTGSSGSRSNKAYSFKAYPGTYTVKAAASDYMTCNTLSLEPVSPNGGSSAPSDDNTLTAKPTDKLKDALNEEVKKKIDECASSTDAEPDGCPFGDSYYQNNSDYSDFSWSVSSYPEVDEANMSDSSFTTAANSGEMDFYYKYRYFYDDDWESENTKCNINEMKGTFSIDGNKVNVKFHDFD